MKNVLLVFGGRSYEHDISVVTASQIFKRTKINDIKLVPFYISRDGKYYVYNSNDFVISDFSISNFNYKKKMFKEVVLVSNENNIIFAKTKFGLKELLKAEFAIFACHGGDGENGVLVSEFESVNIFSQAGNFDSLAVCMNKFLFKQVMYGLKIPTVFGIKVTQNEYESNKSKVMSKISKFDFPLILKPNNGGSSIGLFIAENELDFDIKINDAFEFDNEILVEKYIRGCREFNVAVIGDSDEYTLSEVDEPLKQHEILSFADKYYQDVDGKFCKIDKSLKNSMASEARNFPANISSSLKKRLLKMTETIFTKLNLRGVVRIDFLYSESDNKIYVCEVNSIPGSLAFYFFNNDEISLNNFSQKLLSLAQKCKNNKKIASIDYYTEILK